MKAGQKMQSGSYGSKGTGPGGPGAGKTRSTQTNPAPPRVGANNKGKVSHSGGTKSSLKAGGSSMGSRRRN